MRTAILTHLAILLLATAPARAQTEHGDVDPQPAVAPHTPAPLEAADPNRTDQEAGPDHLIDHGYGFELRRPGDHLQLYGEEQTRSFNPDAVASLVDLGRGMSLMVLSEPAGEMDLDALALQLGGIWLGEGSVTERIERVLFEEQPAYRVQVQGVLGEVPVRIAGLVFATKGRLYQLTCSGHVDVLTPDIALCEPLWASFSLLPGSAAPGRTAGREIADRVGVGWRVKGGVFESANSNLRVGPLAEGWRLVVGDELYEMNDSAEVGLLYGSPDVYAIVLPERVYGGSLNEVRKFLRTTFVQNVGAESSEGKAFHSVDGQSLELEYLRTSRPFQMEYAWGVLGHGEQALQILGWWHQGSAEQARELFHQATAAMDLLDANERRLLDEELRLEPDPQNRVGAGFSLRQGVYRDFENDFTWTQPPGYWRVLVGAQAREQNDAAAMFIEEPALGIMGTVVAERAPGFTNEQLHRFATEGDGWRPVKKKQKPQVHRVSGVEFLTSSWDASVGELPFRFFVATAQVGDRLLQVHLWGYREHISAAGGVLRSVLDGFALPDGDLRPALREPEGFVDLRSGYRLSLPEGGWSVSEVTPPRLEEVGGAYAFERGQEGLVVLTACEADSKQDADWILERMMAQLEMQDDEIRDAPREVLPGDLTMLGFPVQGFRLRDAERGGLRMEMRAIVRDQTRIVVGAIGDGTRSDLDDLFARFQLLD